MFDLTKRNIGLIIIILIGLLILGYLDLNITGIVDTNNNIKIFNTTTSTYSAYGVSFNYPSNWDIQTANNDGREITVLDNNNFSYENVGNTNDIPQFQIQISPTGESDQDSNYLSQPIPVGWQKISNKTLDIDNNIAYETIYTINDTADYTEIMTDQNIVFTKNGKIYLLDFQAPINDFENNKPDFNVILNSLKIQ